MPVAKIQVDIKEVLDGAKELVLDSDASASSSTVTVRSIIGVSTDQILLFREPGNERAEIVATHSSTSPSGNTVTLASNLVEGHPAGTTIYIIPADQVEYSHSASEVDANSDDSSLSTLSTGDIDPTEIKNYYSDTSKSSGYYYWRFVDSVNTVNLKYSDPIPYSTDLIQEYEEDEVGFIAEYVRKKFGRQWDKRFSIEDIPEEANLMLDYISEEFNGWSHELTPDYVLGQTQRGVYSFSLPSNVYDDSSNRSILNVRVEGKDYELYYVDEKEFDRAMDEAKLTAVRTQASAGDTTLKVDNSYSFDDDGTIHVFTSNTDDEITYTGVTRSATAGVLTGVPASGDGAIGATHAVSTNVWQDYEEGQPKIWTVKGDGNLYMWPLPDSSYINFNILIDYYSQATRIDSLSDKLDRFRRQVFIHWLSWKLRSVWENNNKIDIRDDDYVMFLTILQKAKRNTRTGQKWKMRPKINEITYRDDRNTGKFFYT